MIIGSTRGPGREPFSPVCSALGAARGLCLHHMHERELLVRLSNWTIRDILKHRSIYFILMDSS